MNATQTINRFNATTFEALVANLQADQKIKTALMHMFFDVQNGTSISSALDNAEEIFGLKLDGYRNLLYGGASTLDVYEKDTAEMLRKLQGRKNPLVPYHLAIMKELSDAYVV